MGYENARQLEFGLYTVCSFIKRWNKEKIIDECTGLPVYVAWRLNNF